MDKIYSTAHLMGGLGNQLFEIAHATAQGWKNNIDTFFYTESNIAFPNTKFEFSYEHSIFRNIKIVHEPFDTFIVWEESFNDPNLNFTFDKAIKFYGYYQSSKNFFGYDNQIREMYSPTEEFCYRMESIYPQIKANNTLSIHVRRNDYVAISHILPPVDISYINECIRRNSDYDYVFIFSDDKEWVRQNLNYRDMIIVDGLKSEDELWLMSMCKNNVIVNSTFSWWGSFLNKNPNKKVYCPSIWFGNDGPKPYYNLYESYWNIVDVKHENGLLKVI